MNKRLLIGTVALAAMTTSALAADLPSRRAPPVYVPPIPVFSWTGFYIGGQIGYDFGRDRIRFTAPAGVAGATASGHPDGIIGGGHVGYNFSSQSLGVPFLGALGGGLGAGGLVIGVEGDIDGSDYRDTLTRTIGGAAATATLRNEVQGSARGRVGIAVDRALFYATGGAAFAQFQNTYAAAAGFATLSNTRVGWTVGGGVEYAVTTQWSLRAEYRYSDFGSFNQAPGGGVALTRREIMERAQVGFSYKFDTPAAPVVARY